VNEHTFHSRLLVPFMLLFVNTTEQEVLSFHMQSVLPRVNQNSYARARGHLEHQICYKDQIVSMPLLSNALMYLASK